MESEFEWDPDKDRRNLLKHGVSFVEAATVFEDPLALTSHDDRHWGAEERYIILGISTADRLLVVVHADRGHRIRLISARPATARERRAYEEGS